MNTDNVYVLIHISAPYQKAADRAQENGWLLYKLEAGHFHMLVNAAAVADLVEAAVNM